MRLWKRKTQSPGEKRDTRRAVIALWILAPLSGEMMSGSTTPLEWLNPVSWIMLGFLYGSGALLVREFVRRWNKGWPSILLLGLAYGIYEEGIVVRSFFDPAWGDLDILAWYGRWLGVNWVWTICLTLFHAVVSITIPILLVELIYPDQRKTLWLTRRGMKVHGLMFGSMAIIGIAFEMHAPPLGYVGCVLAMLLCWRFARRWPDPAPDQPRVERLPRPRRVAGFGFIGMIGFLGIMWIIPSLEPPALLSVIACFALPALLIRWAKRLGVWSWGPRQQWAAAAGALGFWIVIAFLMAAGPDMPIAGVLCIYFLWRVRRHVWRLDPPAPTADQLVPPPLAQTA
ncbi:MAG: hypothetical protein HY866_18885 [Chloroflexi bacterium]|nr:hypothetical protein [Chloroflexota bacterium]